VEHFPVVSDLLKAVDERLGRRWGTLLLLVAYVSVIAGLLTGLWKWFGAPLADFIPKLFGAGPIITQDDLAQVVSTATVFVVLTGAAAIIIPLVNNLSRRRVPQAAIDELADLRSEGIAVLNDVPKTADDVVRWHGRWTGWRDRVVASLGRNFTRAEMLSFDRLGVIAEVAFGFAATPEHRHYLMQLNKQLTILENLIQRHQERR
jgi:hypothetical protein